MNTATVKVLQGRLTRGTPVIVADSVGQPALRGASMIVASKRTVKCNGKGRCAGDWCKGLAVFVAAPDTLNDDKQMGWRSGTNKVCLTHIKTEDGELVLPPPQKRGPKPRTEVPVNRLPVAPNPAVPNVNGNGVHGPVTWSVLAQAAQSRNFEVMEALARQLKTENERLLRITVDAQTKLIGALTKE